MPSRLERSCLDREVEHCEADEGVTVRREDALGGLEMVARNDFTRLLLRMAAVSLALSAFPSSSQGDARPEEGKGRGGKGEVLEVFLLEQVKGAKRSSKAKGFFSAAVHFGKFHSSGEISV